MTQTHGMEICMKQRIKPEHLPFLFSVAAVIFAALFNLEKLGHQIWFLVFFLVVAFGCGYVGSVFIRRIRPGKAGRKTTQILVINAITFATALVLLIGWLAFI